MADPDLSDLVQRRADLLATAEADRSDADQAELDRATRDLEVALAGREPSVRRVTPTEPGDLLERLAAAEPVHPIQGARDLADRLDDDRRCFVLEHPLLRGRPLNVVWVALWTGVPADLGAILDPTAPTADPTTADTAVFYSIWNVEPGLVGLPGGRSLITGAVAALRQELPALSTFVTLSPVPGFRSWLDRNDPELAEAAGMRNGSTDDRIHRACAEYLTTFGPDDRLIDPVARFHMGNGARLLALPWAADRSDRGEQRSFGIMANYRYEPEDRVLNRERLANRRPQLGSAVAELLGTASPA